MSDAIYYVELPSPLGELLLLSDGESLAGLYFTDHRRGPAPGADWRRDKAPFKQIEDELAEYFAGESCEFNVRLAPRGSEFRREVWNELRRIPLGTTLTYAELAARSDAPRPCGPQAPPTLAIRSRSSCRAIEWWAPAEP